MYSHFHDKKRRGLKMVGWIILGSITAVAFAFLFGLVVQWLWNKVMVDIFPVPVITYWQAVGLIILCKALFGFGGHWGGNRKEDKSKRRHFKHPPWEEFPEEETPSQEEPTTST